MEGRRVRWRWFEERVANCRCAEPRRIMTGLNFLYKSRNGSRMCRFCRNGRKKTNGGLMGKWDVEEKRWLVENIMDINVAPTLIPFAPCACVFLSPSCDLSQRRMVKKGQICTLSGTYNFSEASLSSKVPGKYNHL